MLTLTQNYGWHGVSCIYICTCAFEYWKKKRGSFTPGLPQYIYKYVDMCLSRWNFPGLISQPYWNRMSMRCFRIGKALPTAKAMAFLLRAFYCFAEWFLPAQKADVISSHQGTDSVWRGRVTRPLGDVHGSAGRAAEYNRWSILNWHGLSFGVQLCKQTWCCPLYPEQRGSVCAPRRQGCSFHWPLSGMLLQYCTLLYVFHVCARLWKWGLVT